MKFQKINQKIKRRLVFLSIIFLCFASSIYLISYALKDKISFFYSPTELKHLSINENQIIRVGGLLNPQSLELIQSIWYFEIIDENRNTIKVIFEKTLPNLVEENKGIIVEGILRNNSLYANTVLAKHDENYMPQSTIDKLKLNGVWRGN